MLKPNEFFSIQTSLESLSLKFKELENSHFGLLKKIYKDNEKSLREPKMNSDQVQFILKEQGKLENDIKKVGSLGEAYTLDMQNLKEMILNRKKLSPQEEAEETVASLQHLVKSNISSIRDKIFSLNDFTGIDKAIVYQMNKYFDESVEQVTEAFGHLDSYTESLRGLFAGNNCLIRIEELCASNENQLKTLDGTLDQLKNKIQNSSAQFENQVSSFTKDSQYLKENLTQIKTHIKQFLKDAKSESIKVKTPDDDFSFKARKALLLTDQMLDETVNFDGKKNKTFTSLKEEFSTFINKAKTFIKDASQTKEGLSLNQKSIMSLIREEVIRAASRLNKNDSKEKTLKFQPGSSKKTKSLESPTRVLPKAVPEVEERRQSRGSEMKGAALLNENEKLKSEADEVRREYENFVGSVNQKLSYLKTSCRNFLISSAKMTRYVNLKSVEQELVLKIYENDKKALENYLSTINDFAVDVRHKQTKLPGTIRSQSSDTKKRPSTPGSPFIDEDERNEYFNSRTPPKSGNKIKDMIDDFEKSNSHILKTFERDLSVTRLKSQPNPESPVSHSDANSKEDNATVRKELFTLKLKYDQLSIENRQIKEENFRLSTKSPQRNDNVEALAQLKSKVESLESDKKKLAQLAKKFEAKSVERKNNIKQLFLVIEEKDREIEYYKNRTVPPSSQSERMGELIRHEQSELEKNVTRLEQELKKKEQELSRAIEAVNKLTRTSSPHRNPPSFGGMNVSESADHSFDLGRREQKIELLQQDLKDLEVKKQKLLDAIPSVESISTTKAAELNDLIINIDKERENIAKKIQNLQSGNQSFDNTEQERRDAKEKIIDLRLQIKSLQNERDIIKEASLQQEFQIEQMKTENRNLQEKYNDMAEDLNNAVDHRKKIEKNSQDTINLLNSKIKELTEYISELELKQDIRTKESQHAEKIKSSPFVEKAPQGPEYDIEALQEFAGQLEGELSTVSECLDDLCNVLGIPLDTFGEASPSEKAARLIEIIQEREEQNKKDEAAKLVSEKHRAQNVISPKNSKSKNEYEIVKKQNSDLELIAASLKAEMKSKVKENEDLAGMIRKKENEVKKLQLECENRDITVQKLSNQLKELEPRLIQTESDLENILLSVSTISKKHNLKKVDGLQSAIQVLESLDTTFREHKRLKEELQSKDEIFSSKEEDLRGAFELKEKTYMTRQNDLEASLQTLRQSNEALKKDFLEKEQLLSMTQDTLNDLKLEDESRKKEVERLKKENQAFRDESSTLQGKIDELTTNLNDERDQRQKESKAYKDKIDGYLRDKKRTDNEYQTLLAQKEALDTKVQELELQVHNEANQAQEKVQSDFKAKLTEKDQQISQIKREFNRKIDELNTKFWNDTEKYNNKIEDLSSQVKQLEAEKRALEITKKQLKETVDSKDKEIFGLCDQYSSAAKAKMDAEDALKIKSRECELVKSELEALKVSNESSISELQKQNKNLGQEKVKLEQDLRVAKETNNQSLATIQELNNQLEELSKEKSQLSDRITGTEGKSTEFQTALEQREKEISSLKETLKILNKAKDETESELKFAQAALNQNRNMVIQMELALETKSRETQSKHDELSNIKRQLESQSIELDTLRSELEPIRTERDSLRGDLDKESNQAQSQIKNLQLQLKNALEQLKSLQELQLATVSEKQELEMENEKLHNEKDELLAERDREEKDLVERLASVELALHTKEGQLKDLKNELKHVKENYEKTLADSRLQASEKESQIENIFAELEKSKKIMQDQNVKITQITARAQSLENQNAAISAEKEALLAEKALISKESGHALENVSNQIKQYEFAAQNANNKIEELNRELKESAQEKEDLQIINTNLAQKLEKYQGEMHILKETIYSLNLQIEDNQGAHINKNEEIAELKEEIAKITKNYEDNIAGLNSRLQKEKEDRLLSSSKKKTEIEENSKLSAIIRDQEDQISDLKTEEARLTKEIESLSHKLSDSEKERTRLSKQLQDFEVTSQQLRNSNNSLTEEKNNLQAQIDTQEETINELSEAKQTLECRIAEYCSQIDALKEDYNASIDALGDLKESVINEQAKVQQLEERNTQLEADLKQANEKLISFELQSTQWEAKESTLTETNTVLNRKLNQLTTDFELLKSLEDQRTVNNASESNQKVEELLKENENLKAEIRDLKEKVELSEGQISHLTSSVVELKSQKQDLITQLKDDQQEREDEKRLLENKIILVEMDRDNYLKELKETQNKSSFVIQQLEDKIASLKEENQGLQDENHQLEEIQATNNRAELEEKINLLNTALKKINDEKDTLQNQYDVLKHREDEWAEENENLRNALVEKDQIIFDLDSKNSENIYLISNLENELKIAKENISNVDEDEHHEIKEKNLVLINRIKDLELSLTDLQKQNTNLVEIKAQNEFTIEELNKKYSKLESASGKKGDQKEQMIKELNREIEILSKENFNLKGNVERLNQANVSLQNQADEANMIKEDLKRLNQNVVKLEKENQALEAKLAEQRKMESPKGLPIFSQSGFFVPSSGGKKDDGRSKDLSPGKEELKGQVSELQQEKKFLETNISDLKDELEMLKTQNQQIIEQIDKNNKKGVQSPVSTEEGAFSFRGNSRVSFAFEGMKQLTNENEDLKTNYERLQDQFIEVSEERNRIKTILTQGFASLVTHSLFDGEQPLQCETPREIEEALEIIKDVIQRAEARIQAYDRDNDSIHEASEKEVDALRSKLLETERNTQRKIDYIKGEVEKEKQQLANKFNRISSEISSLMNLMQLKPMTTDDSELNVSREEKVVITNIKSLAEEIRRIKSHLSKSVKTSSEMDLENLQIKLKEFEQREKELIELNEQQMLSIEEKDAQIENMKKSLTNKDIGTPNPFDKSISLLEEIDDKKVKSYLEEEHIRSMRLEIRTLEDHNQNLEAEYRKAKSDYDLLKFKYENIKEEIADNEANYKNMEFQLSILKKELMETEGKYKNILAHEREGIKMMFVKFMEGSLEKQTKEALEYLKTLLTMMGFPDKEKQITLDSFKSKSAKKGTFSKMFS